MTNEELRRRLEAFATGCRVWIVGESHPDPVKNKSDAKELRDAGGDSDLVDWATIETCILIGRSAYERLETLQNELLWARRYSRKGKQKGEGEYVAYESIKRLVKESQK